MRAEATTAAGCNDLQVTAWDGVIANYSLNYALGAYLARTYGGAALFSDIVQSSSRCGAMGAGLRTHRNQRQAQPCTSPQTYLLAQISVAAATHHRTLGNRGREELRLIQTAP